MAEKNYYWLRLKKDFFKRHDIRIIESMPNGKDYILFYLKLLVESVSHEGNLRFSDTIPYSNEMLATVTDTNIDIVRSALKIFTELGMIEVLDDSTIFMSEVLKMIGSATGDDEAREAARLRKQKQRERERLALEQLRDSHVTCHVELEKEKELKKELDIELESKEKRKRFTPPTLDEVKAFIRENNYTVNADRWFDYYSANGWKVGKNPMKDWKASVRYWNKDQKPAAKNSDQAFIDEWTDVMQKVRVKDDENGYNGVFD